MKLLKLTTPQYITATPRALLELMLHFPFCKESEDRDRIGPVYLSSNFILISFHSNLDVLLGIH